MRRTGLEALGARQVSIGQGDVSWVVMAYPDGNEFDVLQPLTLVLRRGQVVERGPTPRVLDDPQHDYTRLLRACVPRPGWRPSRRDAAVTGPG